MSNAGFGSGVIDASWTYPRGFHLIPVERRRTVAVDVDGVRIGGDAPVVVQSMTNTDTADVEATFDQIRLLADAGSELVRVTVNNDDAAQAVPEIVSRLFHPTCVFELDVNVR